MKWYRVWPDGSPFGPPVFVWADSVELARRRAWIVMARLLEHKFGAA
jgi:hypothetical protein